MASDADVTAAGVAEPVRAGLRDKVGADTYHAITVANPARAFTLAPSPAVTHRAATARRGDVSPR